MSCVWFELLCRIPSAGLRLHLCRRHLKHCARCREASDSREALPPVLVAPDRLSPGLDLWPSVKREIEVLHTPSASPVIALPAHRSWRWGYAVAASALFLIAALWALVVGRRPMPLAPSASLAAPQVRLCSAKIADRPAQVFQVQGRDPNRSIFWIAKYNPRS